MLGIRGDAYNCGCATIDATLSVQKGDDDFYEFMGENAIYSLARAIHPDDLYRLERGIDELEKTAGNMVVLRMVRHDGLYRWMLLQLQFSELSNDKETLIDFNMEDVTTFKDKVDELQDNNDTYSEYFSLMESLMISYDVSNDILKIFMMGNQKVIFFNGTLGEWKRNNIEHSDIDEKDTNVFNQLCEDIEAGRTSFEHELGMRLLQAEKRDWCLIKGKTIVDSSSRKHVIATLSVINPITKKQETNTTISSTRDAGTDLLNKRTITTYATNLINGKPEYPVTVAIIDLDNFKYVNDTFGHMFGDEVLVSTARIIKEAVGSRGVAGRIGGDEMFIVLENLSDIDEIRSVLRTIRVNVEWEYKDKKENLHLSCSIGCATYPTAADNYDELFKLADKALYLAKDKGKNRYVIYQKELHARYAAGLGAPATREEEFYKYNKVDIVNGIIKTFMSGEEYDIKEISHKIGLTFELDSIYLYKGDKLARTTLWGMNLRSKLDKVYFDADNYRSNFDKKRIFVNDNTKSLEKRFDTAFKALTDMKICASIQYYTGGYDSPTGFISFNKSKLAQKWSEIDIAYLSILGQVLGMELIDGEQKDSSNPAKVR